MCLNISARYRIEAIELKIAEITGYLRAVVNKPNYRYLERHNVSVTNDPPYNGGEDSIPVWRHPSKRHWLLLVRKLSVGSETPQPFC